MIGSDAPFLSPNLGIFTWCLPTLGIWQEAAQQTKEELVDNCIQTWLSNGVGVESFEELATQQFQFSDTDLPSQYPSIGLEQKEGYRSVTLDDRSSKDQETLEQRRKLRNLLGKDRPLSRAVDHILEQEIDQRELLAFESESIFDIPSASTLSFHDKVHLIAKHRLLKRELKPEPEPQTEVTLKHEPNIDPQVKMSMLRVTAMSTLHLESFFTPLSPEYCLECFHALLEEVAEPYASIGISNRELLDHDLYSTSVDSETRSLTESEKDEWYQSWRLRSELSNEQLASWSYRLSDAPGNHAQKSARLYTDWLCVDTKEQFEGMSSLIKDRNLSAVLIRTWKIDEAKRVAQANEAKRKPSRQDSPPPNKHSTPGSSMQGDSSVRKYQSLALDEERRLQDFGNMEVDILSESKVRKP
ncbi:hypothetical protein F4814DRAFT_459935 [Daldinia grandis]|nr:hypothetical protein F4814DRAFT_459935 [Daldinia grandis]